MELLKEGTDARRGDRAERVDLLGGNRARAEDERIALLALVLLGVDVEGPPLYDGLHP